MLPIYEKKPPCERDRHHADPPRLRIFFISSFNFELRLKLLNSTTLDNNDVTVWANFEPRLHIKYSLTI